MTDADIKNTLLLLHFILVLLLLAIPLLLVLLLLLLHILTPSVWLIVIVTELSQFLLC